MGRGRPSIAAFNAGTKLDWEVHYVDGTVVRAHQHAAGAKKGDPATEALGRSQGGFSTKVHIRAEGHSRLMTVALIPGQRHETTAFETLMEQGAVKCAVRGRPKLRPRRLIGDKGYSSRKMVSDLKIGARCLFSCLVVNEVHGGFSIIRGE